MTFLMVFTASRRADLSSKFAALCRLQRLQGLQAVVQIWFLQLTICWKHLLPADCLLFHNSDHIHRERKGRKTTFGSPNLMHGDTIGNRRRRHLLGWSLENIWQFFCQMLVGQNARASSSSFSRSTDTPYPQKREPS